jgi:MFS family permease
MFFLLSLYMQQVLGYSALETGLAYLPLAFMIILSAGFASQLVNRIGFKPTLVTGMLVIAGALVWFTQVSPGGSYVSDILFPSIIVGIGLGLAFVPVTVAAVSGTLADEAGLASGLINTSQQIGGAVGVAVCSSVLFSSAAYVTVSGTTNAFWVLVGISVAALVASVVLIRKEQLVPASETQSSPGLA